MLAKFHHFLADDFEVPYSNKSITYPVSVNGTSVNFAKKKTEISNNHLILPEFIQSIFHMNWKKNYCLNEIELKNEVMLIANLKFKKIIECSLN